MCHATSVFAYIRAVGNDIWYSVVIPFEVLNFCLLSKTHSSCHVFYFSDKNPRWNDSHIASRRECSCGVVGQEGVSPCTDSYQFLTLVRMYSVIISEVPIFFKHCFSDTKLSFLSFFAEGNESTC